MVNGWLTLSISSKLECFQLCLKIIASLTRMSFFKALSLSWVAMHQLRWGCYHSQKWKNQVQKLEQNCVDGREYENLSSLWGLGDLKKQNSIVFFGQENICFWYYDKIGDTYCIFIWRHQSRCFKNHSLFILRILFMHQRFCILKVVIQIDGMSIYCKNTRCLKFIFK